eukprot:Phypoly_transcript_00254.p1 GENE.Phypoly_transcript_00254~~Phypoly_transcript_00254.p1  ORF type:complete len:661 (+),score=60.90 Phypoly_transcript_00254:1607-3589(+)
MSLEIVPVEIKHGELSITCLDSWKHYLLVGIEKGISVLRIVRYGNALTACEQTIFLPVAPIKQFQVVNSWNFLLVLSCGQLKIYDLTNKEAPEIQNARTFPQTNVEKFAMCPQSMHLCIPVRGKLHIYYHNGDAFYEAYQFCILHSPLEMVMTPARLYGTYKISSESGSGSSAICCSYEFTSKEEVPAQNVFEGPTIDLIANYGGGILIQHGCTSIILDREVEKKVEWFTSPKALVVKEDYLVGITNCVAEAASDSNPRLLSKVQPEDSDPLLYITGQTDIYVASSSKIWAVILPSSRDEPPSAMPTRVPANPTHVPAIQTREYHYPSASLTKTTKEIQCLPFPDNFSPLDSLSVVGLNAADVEYMRGRGVSTVQKFAELHANTMEVNYSVYGVSYCKAVEFMNRYNELLSKEVDVNPEDPLEAIGMTRPQIEFMSTMMVFTVRQLAMLEKGYVSELEGLYEKHQEAVKALQRYDKKREWLGEAYGYLYMTTSDFSYCLDSRTIKSVYILFQEYMDCDPGARTDHPWKAVYSHFYNKAKQEIGFGDDKYDPSDADVFTFLSSRYIGSIGKVDATAASRAIFFCVQRRKDIPGKPQDDHLVEINLNALCKAGGKLYTSTNAQEWNAVTLMEYTQQQKSGIYGCIVTPSGTIDWENIEVSSD